jgi:hypothetical protein
VFGASNVAKLLSRVPAALRRDAARTVCYEAQARIADPVYGSVGTILALQHQVAHTICLKTGTATNTHNSQPPLPVINQEQIHVTNTN